jgi:hypothetical protein
VQEIEINKNCTQKKKKFTIYKMLVVRNSNKLHVIKMSIFLMLSCFSSTYVCESLFATINLIKSKERNVLTNETIAACVSLRITEM